MKKNSQLILPFLATAFIGIFSGSVAAAFSYATDWIFLNTLIAASSSSLPLFTLKALCLSSGGALIAGFLMQQWAKEAVGSGIPQVKEKYMEKQYDFSWSLIAVKFLGGILSIGTGSSLGREGPTIHLGAAIGSKIAKIIKEEDSAKANAMCAGSAAGLAAAFHSPLAGVSLVLEEIAEGSNMNQYAGRCILASAISVATVYLLTGSGAELSVKSNIPMKWEVFFLSPFIALFAGLIGVVFQLATLGLQKKMTRSSIPFWIRPGIGASLSAIFCLIAFASTSHLGAFGLGETDLIDALNNKIILIGALCLLVTKLIATILCYGTGGCGGIFAPLIFLGGMAGVVSFGMTEPLFGQWFHLLGDAQTLLSLIAMTATISAVVRAPLTSILIVMEMTHQFSVLPSLMVAAVIGVFLNTLFFKNNFYNQSLINLSQPTRKTNSSTS